MNIKQITSAKPIQQLKQASASRILKTGKYINEHSWHLNNQTLLAFTEFMMDQQAHSHQHLMLGAIKIGFDGLEATIQTIYRYANKKCPDVKIFQRSKEVCIKNHPLNIFAWGSDGIKAVKKAFSK